MTAKECEVEFIEHVRLMVRWWLNESRAQTHKEKLEGLAHSILAAIDGSAASLPAFKLIPSPHPSDKDYNAKQGDDWWPEGRDIAGRLAWRLFNEDKSDGKTEVLE